MPFDSDSNNTLQIKLKNSHHLQIIERFLTVLAGISIYFYNN